MVALIEASKCSVLRGQDSRPFSRLSQATARELDDLRTGPEHAKKWSAFVAQILEHVQTDDFDCAPGLTCLPSSARRAAPALFLRSWLSVRRDSDRDRVLNLVLYLVIGLSGDDQESEAEGRVYGLIDLKLELDAVSHGLTICGVETWQLAGRLQKAFPQPNYRVADRENRQWGLLPNRGRVR